MTSVIKVWPRTLAFPKEREGEREREMRHIVDYRRKLRRCTSRAEAASALISKTCSARYRPARVHCVTAVNPADGNEWQPKREIELEIMENPSRGYLFLLPLSLSLSLSLSRSARSRDSGNLTLFGAISTAHLMTSRLRSSRNPGQLRNCV